VLEHARDALLARDQASHEAARLTRSAQRATRDAGFDDLDQVADAVLDDHLADTHAADLARLEASRVAAQAVLDDVEVADALAREPIDPQPLVAAVVEAEQARDAAHATWRQAQQRVARLDALLAELDDLLAAWEPVRRDHQVTASLASLVEGKSADNQWRMRLSAYVLSERLRQVVAAANERLGAMTDERYTLAQVDEKGAGEQRGGLSLRVRDEWSGKERDPATLSGGETFLVSLALALGLADTVSHEAGGTQLDTLFVDEGFGALDATTLDGVMDVLDGLRDGGRVVGLVSHVAELRDRVTTRLEVRKARRGSTLSPVLVGPEH
jgi:exonuclease SbcC